MPGEFGFGWNVIQVASFKAIQNDKEVLIKTSLNYVLILTYGFMEREEKTAAARIKWILIAM